MGYYDEDGKYNPVVGSSHKLITFKVTTTPSATVSTVPLKR
jgi:hypothetical protein